MLTRQAVHVAMLLWGMIFSIIAAVCMCFSTNFDREKRIWMIWMQICGAVLLACDSLAWIFRGGAGALAYYGVRISNFVVFFLSDVVLILFHGYVCCCLFGTARVSERHRHKRPNRRIVMVYVIAVIGMLMVIVSQFTHLYYYIDAGNIYHRNKLHILCMLIPFAGMMLDLSIIIQYKKRIGKDIFISLMSYLALPVIATVVQTFYYGISLTNLALCISMIAMFVISMVEQNRQIAMSERLAADLKIELMLSQIAPHFIYNTLTTISQMCESDPKLAKETTIEFSNYLRGNMNSLSRKECIPFERELEHTRYYTAIEKKRFGDRINVVYDTDEQNFLIPPLTLQPLVENAIKHGLCMKKGGGTVKIRTERNSEHIYVIVSDDGAGFDMNQIDFEDGSHIGISNVSRRLSSMCGGNLEVESAPGRGTMAVITIDV